MTGFATAFLVIGLLLAIGDWIARAVENTRLEYVCKPTTLVALILTAVALTPASDAGARRDWFVAALVCSLAGDVLLMLPSDLFIAGLGAFLLGHLFYLAGFWSHHPGAPALAVAGAVVLVGLSPLGARVLKALRSQRPIRLPVAVYMVVIGAMLATALATGNVLAGIGAGLFVSSDTMIAWNRFVRPFGPADVGIMVTYHLGQAALVVSLLR
ncbi:MAG TPA: lysoplasmalogenase [Acidimicrobiales bacterium]|nr:lysoplasmalogenase [Acidimicrobiales bacterium]